MCGIVAVTGYKKALPLLINGLEKLEYRGYDSAGIAVISSETKNIVCNKAEGKLNNLKNNLKNAEIPGTVGIGHTRWATHGKPEVKNAHPHLDSLGKVAVVQNGIIENYQELKSKLEKEGISFDSDTDTEVIPHLIQKELIALSQLNLENNGSTLLVAVRNVISDLEGSYALAVIWSGAPDSLVVARRQAPLIIGLGEGEFICASDTPAIASFTKIILPLEDGEIALLTPLGIEIYDSNNERQYRNPISLQIAEQVIDKNNFRHYMLKEIYDQPEIAKYWLEKYLIKDLKTSKFQIKYPFDTKFFESIERIEIVACGTSKHAAMVGKFLLEQFSGIPTNVFFASEFRYSPPPLLPNTLTIGVTQSGETADTIAAIKMEIQRRASMGDESYKPNLVAITNRIESSIGRQISNIIDIGAGIEIGVAATKTFFAQLLSFYGLAIKFAQIKQSQSNETISQLISELTKLPPLVEELLEKHNQSSEKLAHEFFNIKDVIFLGRGINYPIALEGALKLKEISYIHAAGYPAGEMKHGPIALLDKKVPVISIAFPGEVFDKVISNAQEAKARDAYLIGVAPKCKGTEIFDYLMAIPSTNEWISPLLAIVPLQLLSYHIAAHRGLDVDQPRNLAKSVTVE
ncbi:Glutamine--fructose-6-phosphate transaminase (isomerizing) [Prochlorococcus marinus str. MIT 9515]|uniref:Glutamine--fructose-6-phosphate aminotransferase [isomerizing] n=1 Tax=Prochlorococcus marinus (strain MIT 9515) TaxID=167542 RepID=A2BYZ0_PROM5|nr:glutamine--fructose-6-phosphate transaminase (isomerizing) [Prochlorococcus marinus]ABM73001.1 Glutamine--fructose-6-phosphate transaminase (isomerizing) [Prochlorococcus marinus str. MIT 9515]